MLVRIPKVNHLLRRNRRVVVAVDLFEYCPDGVLLRRVLGLSVGLEGLSVARDGARHRALEITQPMAHVIEHVSKRGHWGQWGNGGKAQRHRRRRKRQIIRERGQDKEKGSRSMRSCSNNPVIFGSYIITTVRSC